MIDLIASQPPQKLFMPEGKFNGEDQIIGAKVCVEPARLLGTS